MAAAELRNLPDGLPVQVAFYDGPQVRALRPVHIDLRCRPPVRRDHPSASGKGPGPAINVGETMMVTGRAEVKRDDGRSVVPPPQ